jgi:hypothetical protein
MKNFALFSLTATVILSLSACELIGDVFQAGVWVGVILVIGVIALIVWMVRGKA